jgi:hypothetical protein
MQQASRIRLLSESRGEQSLEWDQGRRSSPGFRGTDRESKATRTAGIERQRSRRASLHGDDMELGQRDGVTQGLRAGGSARGRARVAPSRFSRSRSPRVCEYREGGIVIVSPYGDPMIPKRCFGTALRASQNACVLVEPVDSKRHPYPPKICPLFGGHIFGGEGGIRTHVPGFPDHLISSQRRCDRFGTSPADRNCNTAISLVRPAFEERG